MKQRITEQLYAQAYSSRMQLEEYQSQLALGLSLIDQPFRTLGSTEVKCLNMALEYKEALLKALLLAEQAEAEDCFPFRYRTVAS